MSYIETKEIAKQVRKELKNLYPETKFSVTSKFNSISVNYVDGAIASDIEAVIQKYNGYSNWDHNYCDYGSHAQVEFRGEMVDTYLMYDHVNRSFSFPFLSEVKDFVENKYGKPKGEIKIVLYEDGSAHFDSSDWESLKNYGEVSRRCHRFASVAEQEQARTDEENKKDEEWKQQLALATAKLEEEVEDAPPITAVVRKIEPFFVEGKFAKLNRNSSIEQYQEECARPNRFNIERCQVVEIIELDNEGYDEFSRRLLEDFDWLAGKGSDCSAVLITAPNRDAFLVSPEGHNYALSVGFVDQKALLAATGLTLSLSKGIAQHTTPYSAGGVIAEIPAWKSIAGNISEILQDQIELKRSPTRSPTMEVITASYHLEPEHLTFLEPKIEIITTQEFQPIQLDFLNEVEPEEIDESRIAEILEARRDRYEEKRDRRYDAYSRLRVRHNRESASRYQSAKQIGDFIPLGQPVLFGHHSERRHRRDIAKIDNNMRASIEHQKTAEHYAGKLAAMESNNAISSDNPDAIALLEAKLTKMQREQETMKTGNKIVRNKKLSDEEKVKQLVAALNILESSAYKLLQPDFCGRVGFADYLLQNNNGNMRRVKERIEELKARLAIAVTEGTEEIEYPDLHLTLVRNREIDRIQLVFDGKPSGDVRSILKSYGFRWSPNEGAWQRQLNGNGEFAAKQCIEKLQNA